MLVQGRVGQHGDAQTAGDHVPQRFQGAALNLHQIALALGIDGRAQFQYLVPETVAFPQQQQGFVQQLVRGDFGLGGPGMIAGQQHGKGFLVHACPHQAAAGEGQRHDNGIQIALFQLATQHVGVVFLDKQGHFRCRGAYFRDHGGEQVGSHRKNGANAQWRAQLVLLTHGHLRQQVRLFQHPLGLGDNGFGLGRDHHFPWATFEQGHAQLLFQLFDRRTESGLAHIAGLGGVAKMALPGQGDEIA